MKKLLLVIFCSPFLLFAQPISHNGNWPGISPQLDKAEKFIPANLKDEANPNSSLNIAQPLGETRPKKPGGYDMHEAVIGTTTYDLQTNGSMARRLQLHADGTVSAVWTGSKQQSASFSDRGSFYNYFDGQSWMGANSARLEPDRAGWPCIVDYDSSGIKKEMIVSHFSTSTGASGGTYWMVNDQIGNGSFDILKEIDMPGGPLWPRTAAGGDYIHAVAVYNSGIVKSGVKNPVVYYRYNVSGNMEVSAQTLPGYDNSRYGQGKPDSYDIDVRDNIVAILIGDPVSDLALWKSTDYGKSWNKTVIDTFAHAPYSIDIDKAFYDTVWSNDGRASLVIDQGGIVHVFYPRMRVTNPTSGDAEYSYFPGTDGILYWNDNDQEKSLIAGTPDLDGLSWYLDIAPGTYSMQGAAYGSALATMPHAAVDANDNIYMVFTAPNELDEVDILGSTGLIPVNARDIFVVYSIDHGKTWSGLQNLTQGQINNGKEDVYATVARDADDHLHLMWMRDDAPGIYIMNGFSISTNQMVYAAIPIADILENKIENPVTGIQNPGRDLIQGFYPNPAHDNLVVTLNIEQSASANVRMTDMLGKVHYMQSFRKMPAGPNSLNLDISHLKPGMYLLETRVGEKVETAKVLVN